MSVSAQFRSWHPLYRDELVDFTEKPIKGQIREVNAPLLSALAGRLGCHTVSYGIVRDDPALLDAAVTKAVSECDVVLVSGGSSVGAKDQTARVIEKNGSILLHGIAIKPGKPTILGVIGENPVFGLPGHPVAAYFVSQLFCASAFRPRCLGTRISPAP
jgi:molybdopterin molybdotransferase